MPGLPPSVARTPDRWGLAGDQLYVDLDIGVDNLPAGSLLGVGSAVLEVTELPHTGCSKFSGRFGADALRFVNSSVGRPLRLPRYEHPRGRARGYPTQR